MIHISLGFRSVRWRMGGFWAYKPPVHPLAYPYGLEQERDGGRGQDRLHADPVVASVVEDEAFGPAKLVGLVAPENVELTGKGLDSADEQLGARDRKSTRLNSSHTVISYAVF